MSKLGWPGILIPEEYGGSNFGITGISVILEECAKTLTPSPLFATGVLGAFAITNFGNDKQKQNYLPKNQIMSRLFRQFSQLESQLRNSINCRTLSVKL